MFERIRKKQNVRLRGGWFYLICLLIVAALFAFVPISGNRFIWLYLGAIVLFLFAFRPGSAIHRSDFESFDRSKTIISVIVAIAVIAVCVFPMGQFSIWNGEIPAHRNQYELITEAFLEGHLDFAYGDEHYMLELKNPYDRAEREESGLPYHWDHAYYDGHYYMYFGVVPVFLVFMPYRLLTGTSLTTYHATQIFAAVSIAGFFALFYLLAKLFFKKLPVSVYLALATAFSIMSLWLSAVQPALYCTAITSGIALEIWSLYFFVRAVWVEKQENRQIFYAAIGALLGALVFGCRPTIALANILVIPMLIAFLKQRTLTMKLLAKLALAASPYAFVAAGLMIYNYLRFDSPFDFGQTYQLTIADMRNYVLTFDPESIRRLITISIRNFKRVAVNFPVLLLWAVVFIPAVFREMRKQKLLFLLACVVLCVLTINVMDIAWTVNIMERYRMDIYFLLGIGCFIVIGLWHNACASGYRGYLNMLFSVLAMLTIASAFLLSIEAIGEYYPDAAAQIMSFLHLKI